MAKVKKMKEGEYESVVKIKCTKYEPIKEENEEMKKTGLYNAEDKTGSIQARKYDFHFESPVDFTQIDWYLRNNVLNLYNVDEDTQKMFEVPEKKAKTGAE